MEHGGEDGAHRWIPLHLTERSVVWCMFLFFIVLVFALFFPCFMDVDLLPPRIQQFRLKLMRFHYQVLYVPGKLLATADTLSLAPLDSPSFNRVNQVELFAQDVVRSFPDIVSLQLEHLRQAQANDGECSLLFQYCANGWPRHSRLPLHVKKYWQYQGDLSVCEELILKGSLVLVPSALQRHMLELLLDGHQGIN